MGEDQMVEVGRHHGRGIDDRVAIGLGLVRSPPPIHTAGKPKAGSVVGVPWTRPGDATRIDSQELAGKASLPDPPPHL